MSANPISKTRLQLETELEEWRQRAEEAEEVVRAIRAGEIDALVVSSPEGEQVYSLAGAERPYRLMIEEMNEGAVSASPSGTILYCNRRFAEMVQQPMDAIVGTQLASYFVQPFIDFDDSLQHTDWPFRAELQIRTGSYQIPVMLSMNKIIEKEDASLCVVVSDLRERKMAELEITRQNSEISERKAMEAQLALKASELEDSVRQMESFSYSVSHDLRGPLRAIHGFSTILMNDFAPQLPEESHRYIENIRNSCLRMEELITDLLKFSKLSRQQVTGRQINLTLIAEEVFNEHTSSETCKRTKLHTKGDCECFADPSLMRQVMTNLLSNACKFSRYVEEPTIEFGVEDCNGERVFYVKDNGAGFNPKYAERLFGVFQRLHRQDQFEGTGVGLAIVENIIHRHNGRIWAESKVGEGAVFHFTLNLKP